MKKLALTVMAMFLWNQSRVPEYLQFCQVCMNKFWPVFKGELTPLWQLKMDLDVKCIWLFFANIWGGGV